MKKHHSRESQPFGEMFTGIRLTIHGNKEAELEGSRGILEYCSDSVKVNAGRCIIAFKGRGLHLKCMNESDLIIEGFIISIEYIN